MSSDRLFAVFDWASFGWKDSLGTLHVTTTIVLLAAFKTGLLWKHLDLRGSLTRQKPRSMEQAWDVYGSKER
jgi:hypothetical protein